MEYICNICNKKYSGYQSLWIHNKKYHKPKINNAIILPSSSQNNAIILPSSSQNNAIILPSSSQNNAIINPPINKILKCAKCLKIFSHRNNKYRHEKKCNNQIISNNTNQIVPSNNQIVPSTNQIVPSTNQITSTDNTQIINANNVNTGTVNTSTVNTGTVNTGTVNTGTVNTGTVNTGTVNTTINHITINPIGCESVEKLSYEEIKKIFRQHKKCLYSAIEFVNFNEKIPENHNFYNSSLEGKYINVFNTETNTPEKKNKKEFFDKILCSSLNIMQLLYYKVKDNVSIKKQKSLLSMIEELENIAYLSENKKIYTTNFNQISYNKKEIIKKTWSDNKDKLLLEDETSELSCKKYLDSSDDSSDEDSFYYLTESDTD